MPVVSQEKKQIRLASYLAKCGLASRRQAENFIIAGQIKVDGKVIKDLSCKVIAGENKVTYKNKNIALENNVYYLLNKPTGFVSTVKDQHQEQTVISLVPQSPRVFPVGRLDKDSQGLLLLTNDGDLTYRLTHPKFEIKKTYLVQTDRPIKASDREKLIKGLEFPEGLAQADKIVNHSNKEVLITLHQGFNRQIRRMLGALGYQVLSLTRVSEGSLKLGDLALGKYRLLTKAEIDKL